MHIEPVDKAPAEAASVKPGIAQKDPVNFKSFNLLHYIDQYISIRKMCPEDHDKKIKKAAKDCDFKKLSQLLDDLKERKHQETDHYNTGIGQASRFKYIPTSPTSGHYQIPCKHTCMTTLFKFDEYQFSQVEEGLGKIREYIDNAQQISNGKKPKPPLQDLVVGNRPRTATSFLAASPGNGKRPVETTYEEADQYYREWSSSAAASHAAQAKQAQKKRKMKEEMEEQKMNEQDLFAEEGACYQDLSLFAAASHAGQAKQAQKKQKMEEQKKGEQDGLVHWV